MTAKRKVRLVVCWLLAAWVVFATLKVNLVDVPAAIAARAAARIAAEAGAYHPTTEIASGIDYSQETGLPLERMNAEDYRTLRESLGSQKAVAAALGLNHTTLQRREAGTYKVTQEAESQAE